MDNHNQQQQQPVTILKRQQHNLKLTNVLHNMLQCLSLVDVTIYCDDGEVSAHKLVLAASSSYFRNLFARITNPFHFPIIVLREIPANDLRTILQFIYHGEIHIPQNRVESLMRCANYLQIEGMASSTNALNAVLATSAMPHHPLIAPAVMSTNLSSANTSQNMNISSAITNTGIATFTKFHPQYINPTNNTNNTCNQIGNINTGLVAGPGVGNAGGGSIGGGGGGGGLPGTASGTSSTGKQSSRGHGSRSTSNNHQSSTNSNVVNMINNNTSNNNPLLQNSNNRANNNTNSSTSANGKPRHACTTCFKTFTHGFTLKRHMKLHSERRAIYHCDVCSKDYSCKDSYLRHKKSSNHMQHAEFNNRNNLVTIKSNETQ